MHKQPLECKDRLADLVKDLEAIVLDEPITWTITPTWDDSLGDDTLLIDIWHKHPFESRWKRIIEAWKPQLAKVLTGKPPGSA